MAVQDDTVYVRKHVSILYDNSGSMKDKKAGETNLKWCYASYAAQVFTGLLNDTDSLSITFMDGTPLKNLNLDGIRQDAVSAVYKRTTTANADTPISQIGAALTVLKEEGLREGLGENDAGEQYWLVLTTDGVFREDSVNLSVERVADELETILEKYPDLHVVYFGIGTQNDSSASRAVDFREGSSVDKELLNCLHAHPNFTAVYAENQEQIVATMQALSNQISGRYSVSNDYKIVGNQIHIYLSGEGSPIRNIAIMAQETNAKLVSATAEDGSVLKVGREAQIRYPYNTEYANVSEDTLGGYVALITGQSGEKLPKGTVTLTFSEPIDENGISLMYEPAIHIRLQVEHKTAEGQWEMVPENADLVEGDELRIGYSVCEDETGAVLDTTKLFGKTEATILYNGEALDKNETVTVTKGDVLLDARVSMMDGGYQISASRTLHIRLPDVGDFTVTSAGPIELRRSEVAENIEQYIEFVALLRGEPANASITEKLELKVDGDAGHLSGTTEKPADHIFRFVPRDDSCKAGTYTVHLLYDGAEVSKEEIRILPNEVTYSAEAGQSISIMSNHVSDNDSYVTFTVIAHRDEGDMPITADELELFSVRSMRGGQSFNGYMGFLEEGVITFTPQDSAQEPGDYSVSLWKGDQKLAETAFSVIHYDATYTVETVISDPNTVDRFALQDNRTSACFIVYEDDVPCTPAQLEAMLGRQILVTTSLSSPFVDMDVSIGEVNGKTALICVPTSSTRSTILRFFHYVCISSGIGGLAKDSFDIFLKVDMVHGTEEVGTLHLIGYKTSYLIIFVVFLLCLILILMLSVSNLRAVRMKKGKIWYFCVQQSCCDEDVSYHIAAVSECRTGMGARLMLIPRNERHYFKGLLFIAKPNIRRARCLQHTYPEVTVAGTPQLVGNYFLQLPNRSRTQLLNEINSGMLMLLNEYQFGTLVNSAAALLPTREFGGGAERRVEKKQVMQNAFVLYSTEDLRHHIYHFWCFSESVHREYNGNQRGTCRRHRRRRR